MDREKVLCALDQAQLGRLVDWFRAAGKDDAVSVLVLTGTGRACFADPATKERLRAFLEARRTERVR